jgi:hypothetical protein
MSGDIFYFGADGSRHRIDDPRPKSGTLRRALHAASDAVVLDNEFGAPRRFRWTRTSPARSG